MLNLDQSKMWTIIIQNTVTLFHSRICPTTAFPSSLQVQLKFFLLFLHISAMSFSNICVDNYISPTLKTYFIYESKLWTSILQQIANQFHSRISASTAFSYSLCSFSIFQPWASTISVVDTYISPTQRTVYIWTKLQITFPFVFQGL